MLNTEEIADVAFTGHTRRLIDAEYLLWWAFEQTGYLPWRGVHPRELMLDGGYDVVPKGVPRAFHGSVAPLRCDVPPDAAIVLEAVRHLDPFTASLIRVNAKAQRRPDWMEGVEPKQVKKTVSWRKKKAKGRKRGHRSYTVMVWEGGISPETICAVRELYQRWHAGVTQMADRVRDSLTTWEISGFRAKSVPWEVAEK